MKCNLTEMIQRQEPWITRCIVKLTWIFFLTISTLPDLLVAQSSSGNNVSVVPSVLYTFPVSRSTASPPTLLTPSGDVTDNVTFVSEPSSSGNDTSDSSVVTLPPSPFPTIYHPSTSSITTPFSMDISAEAIVGIVVGCAVYIVLMILVVYIICWCTRRRRNSMSSSSGLPVFPDPALYGQPPRVTSDGRKAEVGRYQRQLDEYSITDVVVDITPNNVSREVRSGPVPAKVSGIIRQPTRHDVIPHGQRPSRRDKNILNRHNPRSPLERSDSFDY